MRLVVVERQLGEPADRGGRVEVVDVDLAARPRGCARTRAPAPRRRAAPCCRSSSRSSASSCACARRSRPPARRRSRGRRTRCVATSRISLAGPLRVAPAHRRRVRTAGRRELPSLDPVSGDASGGGRTTGASFADPCSRRGNNVLVRTLARTRHETRHDDGDRHLVGLIGAGIGPSLSPPLHEREAGASASRYAYGRIDLDGARARAASDRRRCCARPATLGFAGSTSRIRASSSSSRTSTSSRPTPARSARSTRSCSATAARPATTPTSRASSAASPRAAGRRARPRRGRSARAARAPPSRTPLLGARAPAADGRRRRRRPAAELAAALARRFGPATPARAAGERRSTRSLRAADGLVHATPTGMERPSRDCRSPRSCCTASLWVADVVYRPLETELLRAARERGCRTLDGGGMAVFQAAEAVRAVHRRPRRPAADAAPLRRRSSARRCRGRATGGRR